ncbi:CDP-2,3-bis-(O-geranylgeranyl)-sn-glycerol synthase [Stetteria hydrogenophila]
MDLAGAAACILEAFKYYLPAYVANAAPVVVKGKRPIDGGRLFIDGRRLLGDGKTWEGLAGGILAGALVAALLAALLSEPSLVPLGLVASASALLGDMAGSFIKRRLGLERGQPAPLLDQLDFYAAATLGLYLAGARLSLGAVLALAVVTLALHRATNYAAYKLGLKDVPY